MLRKPQPAHFGRLGLTVAGVHGRRVSVFIHVPNTSPRPIIRLLHHHRSENILHNHEIKSEGDKG